MRPFENRRRGSLVMYIKPIAIPAVFCIALCGCVSGARVHSVEVKMLGEQTYKGRLDYAGSLAEQYIALADEATGLEDVAAFGTITAAAVGAGGLLYGAHVDVLKGAGLAAGTIGATRAYTSPAEDATHLYEAAEALLCIKSVGAHSTPSDGSISVLNEGINKVRINLRKKLVQRAPNYRDILDQIKNTYAQRFGPGGEVRVLSIEDELREKINNCIINSIST